ncbi:MAG: tripartite tricarboxylate transporter substrate binding protein [Betaproteobacteria bacterium]|nr:tripartite tricarboxylate transporter substrate binding protein [Betaproteobacteria bacterium]
MGTAVRIALAVVMAAFFTKVGAQDFPNKPVRLLLGYAAGGGIDVITRAFAQRLGENLGQSVVVDNRPGANGTVALDILAKSPADGHTLFMTETGYLIFSTLSTTAADPLKSFAPVTSVALLPLLIAVAPDFPAKNAQELIAVLKANPNKYSYGTPGVGTVHHLAVEQLKQRAGVEILHVPYKGSPPIMADLLGGHLSIAMISTVAASGPSRAGKIRVIALVAGQRVAMAPEWPSLAETLPGFDATPLIFMVVHSGTPPSILARINAAARKALSVPELSASFTAAGAVPAQSSPEELHDMIARDLKRFGALAKIAGVRVE